MDIKKNREIDKKIIKIAKLAFICTGLFSSINGFASTLHSESLIQLNDSELSDVSGQALMSLSYIAPNDSINNMQGQDVGFYKLGLEAELDLNANIKKLQLGCGGVNGAGGCDIDIDNLSLSGIADTREGRVGSSAKLTNPFVEFAIKNPNSVSTREVVGLRLSAEKVLGLLTTGIENSDLPNGINSLSGAIKIKATTGTASTAPRAMTFNDTDMPIRGNIKMSFLPTVSFATNNYNLGLQSAGATLEINAKTLYGNRMNSALLTGKAKIDELFFRGTIRPILAGFDLSFLQLNASGSITGLTADLDINQSLGYIHNLELNNPFSLSLQQQSVWWPNAEIAAQRGWWLAIEDEIDIGKVIPKNQIEVNNDILKQVIPSLNTYLGKRENTVICPSIFGCVLNEVAIGRINLSGTNPLYFPIKDLPLATQGFAPNCYGNLKFC
ncbi:MULTISPECIES: hypothetical protein [Acinetobacter]|uniref:hypothetical protein n=1 Tax=Acinetobacter TaxID=469 RepID=UPI00141A7B34|nr:MULTISPECIES: hypothetical protein [Acinetobacter]MCS4297595.1 hypothetical protein [Acinetobacter guillouiae]MCW2249725.1 hypothetical protein [Acinetobacter sp. BIGb0204]NII38829.1 hypothetical protein [Acinetobacter sp. BIGb0196]